MRTDGGNVIYDLMCGIIARPDTVAVALKQVTGVVEHGLFLGLAEKALVAEAGGVRSLTP